VHAKTDKATLVPHENLDSKIKERKTYIRHQKELLPAQNCPVSKGTEWRGRRRRKHIDKVRRK
jgi:hypothetical protein